jgi:hypothetical protein
MKKILVILATVILTSCGSSDVALNNNFLIVENVQQNTDGSFEISLRNGNPPAGSTKNDANIHFTSKFRLQAGDTMWSRYQLKEYNIDRFTKVSIENTALRDTINMVRTALKNAELENQLLKNYYYTSINKK